MRRRFFVLVESLGLALLGIGCECAGAESSRLSEARVVNSLSDLPPGQNSQNALLRNAREAGGPKALSVAQSASPPYAAEQNRQQRGRLGVHVGDVTANDAAAIGLPVVQGALIAKVEPGTPAAATDLSQGEVILAVSGQAVRDKDDLIAKITSLPPGTAVRLVVFGNGRKRAVEIRLDALPEDTDREAPP